MTNKEWFISRKWGLMFHYLQYIQNGDYIKTRGKKFTDWDTCVNEFDVKKFVENVKSLNPGYVIFSIGQGGKFWCAPNKIYDQITGYKPGEACSTRDLIADVIAELKKYDIPFFMYLPADGPWGDVRGGERMGFRNDSPANQVDDKFIRHWCMVIREYSLRYGTDIKGWWIDGCYDFRGFKTEYLEQLCDAAKAGNPDALVTTNNGVDWKNYENPKFAEFYNASDYPIRKMEKIEDALLTGLYDSEGYMESDIEKQFRSVDDYTAGEKNKFEYYPSGKELPVVWHTLCFLGHTVAEDCPKPLYQSNGSGWGAVGSQYSAQYMYDYVKKVNDKKGVVSIDTALFRDGSFDCGQMEVLRLLGDLRK